MTAVAADRALFPRIIDGVQMVATLYRVRDTVLDGSTEGRHYRDLYETHTAAINRILLTNGDLRRRGGELLRFTQPGLDALAEGRGSRERITPALVAEVRSFLVDLAAAADVAGEPELVNAISREMNFLAWDHGGHELR